MMKDATRAASSSGLTVARLTDGLTTFAPVRGRAARLAIHVPRLARPLVSPRPLSHAGAAGAASAQRDRYTRQAVLTWSGPGEADLASPQVFPLP